MRAVTRVRATFALLALVAIGFSATVRVCGPADALAKETTRSGGGVPLVTAVIDAPELVAEDTAAGRSTDLGAHRTPRETPDNPAAPTKSGESRADAGPDGLALNHVSVWDAPDNTPYVYLSFMPIMSDSSGGDVRYHKAMVGGEEVDVADVAPELDEDHVHVELDGEHAAVASLQWYYAGYGDLAGADVKYMPICLVRVARPDLEVGAHDVRITVEDLVTGQTGSGSATFTCGTRSGEL